MTANSGCLDRGTFSGGYSGDGHCLFFEYEDGGKLKLTHQNALFNCCSKQAADIDIAGRTIVIKEYEFGEYCYCLCLYNLEYNFYGISPDVYTFIFTTNYSGTLEVSIDFREEDSFRVCNGWSKQKKNSK